MLPFEPHAAKTMRHLLLCLFVSVGLSVTVPSTYQGGPLLLDIPSEVILNHINASSTLSYKSEIDPEAGGAAIASTAGDNTENSGDFERQSTSVDNVKYTFGCYKDNRLLTLTQDDMFLKVNEIVSDINNGAGTYHWGDHLPGTDDIGIYSHIVLRMWEPPVDADLLRDMFRVLVYSYACTKAFGEDKTQGGWIRARRRPEDDMLAFVEICSKRRG
jgi:hypothetical protein